MRNTTTFDWLLHVFLSIAFFTILATAGDAHAQRSQALCKDALPDMTVDPPIPARVDGVNCFPANFRLWAPTELDGIEEDAIIGVGSADVTLSQSDLADLETDRVVIVDAPGAGKYLWLDWLVVVRSGTGATAYTGGSTVIGFTVAPETGGIMTGDVPHAYLVTSGFGGGIFQGSGPDARRLVPWRGGIGITSEPDTPIVALVSNSSAADWNAMTALIPAGDTLRIIARYRVIDTTATF